MDREALRNRLAIAGLSEADLDAALAGVCERGEEPTEERAIAWLLREGRLPWSAAMQLSGEDNVTVTELLPERLRVASSATVQMTVALASQPDLETLVGPITASTSVSQVQSPSARDKPPDIGAPPVISAAASAAVDIPYRYAILGVAGRGGMGTVHVARDLELLRRVALKQLELRPDAGADQRARFLREAQITAQLDHPHIVPVYGLELAPGGEPAYAMRLVQGKTFAELIEETRASFEDDKSPDEAHSLAQRLEHFLKVCDAVAYAHDKGVIHRDLKPANLMLGRHNEVYVMDWGICRLLGEQSVNDTVMPSVLAAASDETPSATQLGGVIGTPRYMSPEQAQGRNQELDPRSDQCALGLILHELVCLRAAIDGRQPLEVLHNAATGKRLPVQHAYRQPVLREIAAIIQRATAYEPDRRYSSVRELAADLRRYLRGEAVKAHPDNLWQKLQRFVVRYRQATLATILGLVAVGASGFGLLHYQQEQALVAQRRHEHRLLVLLDAVAERGDFIQRRMLAMQNELESFGSVSAEVIQHGGAATERYYMLSHFKNPATAPADLQASPNHSGSISYEHSVWFKPRTMPDAEALPTIQRLANLEEFGRRLYQRCVTILAHTDLKPVAADSSPTVPPQNPIAALTLGLSNGIGSRYPGWDGLGDDYDPRQRPWYQLVAGKRDVQWGAPYISSITGQPELPISMPLYDHSAQQFLGVASALVAVEPMMHSLLDLGNIPAARRLWLLDAQGNVLASSHAATAASPTKPDNPALRPFPVAELLTRIERGQGGAVESDAFGAPQVFVFDTIHPMGWTLVALTDEDRLAAIAVPE